MSNAEIKLKISQGLLIEVIGFPMGTLEGASRTHNGPFENCGRKRLKPPFLRFARPSQAFSQEEVQINALIEVE